MADNHLHILCHDVPYPPEHGGLMDLFYKIEALSSLGVNIHLHCFEYGRGQQPVLNQYCHSVHYYQRKQGHKGFSAQLPYIVCSRTDGGLLERLLADNHPILAEGIHCSYLLNDPRFKDRKIVLRLHNTEYSYYRQLCAAEGSLLRKLYYWHESKLLRRYEKSIAPRVHILAAAEQDVLTYKQEFGADNISYLPVFVPSPEIKSREGQGVFCLYHGNLSVAENERAALWLLEEVFDTLEIPFVVAGRQPSARLAKAAHAKAHTCLVRDPSEEEMQDMIAKAQVHVLPSFNCTGIKLKLINALFNGRHCLVNPEMVHHSKLESLCHIGKDARDLRRIIEALYGLPFSEGEISERKAVLLAEYDNLKNGLALIQQIW